LKHYLYTLFPETLEAMIVHYQFKYGSDATVREVLESNPLGQWFSGDYRNVPIIRSKALKPGLELNDDVVINGRYCNNNEQRLKPVKLWDMLLVLGHGRLVRIWEDERKKNFRLMADPNICVSDDGDETGRRYNRMLWIVD